jgi:UDP-glucose 4-epimerase
VLPAHQAVHVVPLGAQERGQVQAVLPGDAGDQCAGYGRIMPPPGPRTGAGVTRGIPGPAGAADTLTGMKVLVTGGAGYIGSTTAKALEEAGHVPVILDSLLSGPLAFVGDRIFYEGDIADRELLGRIVAEHPDLDATIHMAARIVVPESVEKPYEYYRDNVAKSLELFDELVRLRKPRVLFSSSASLYAIKDDFEVTEDDPLDPPSPYARTKRMIEQILGDIAVATDLRAIILRYFNPIGSDPDLQTGIYAKEPTHVLGQLVMAARGQKPSFTITGTEHPTRDGTGIRDYIHVWDLARAHVRAVERFDQVLDAVGDPSVVINVGRGDGVTVRELVAAFERVFGQEVPITEAPPRPGDAVGAYANVDRAARLLDWRTELSIDDAIASALAWGEKRHEVLGYE